MSLSNTDSGLISEEAYLAAERVAETKHEYIAGYVYAMAGAARSHNVISVNLIAWLRQNLRGTGCQPFGSDMQARLRPWDAVYRYYPDAMISCDRTDDGDGWLERPTALFEIISESTRSVDEREKRIIYQQTESLQAYYRIEQNSPAVVVDYRTPAGWHFQRIVGMDKSLLLPLPNRQLSLPLVELYDGVDFNRQA